MLCTVLYFLCYVPFCTVLPVLSPPRLAEAYDLDTDDSALHSHTPLSSFCSRLRGVGRESARGR